MATGRILIVEDEVDFAAILEYNLEKEGFQVDLETRGDSALETIRKNPPDLIILDLMVPGMDGLELIRMLQRDDRTRAVPVIILLAKVEEVDRLVGFDFGADDYHPKLSSPRKLVSRAKALLNRLDRDEPVGNVLVVDALRLDVEGRRLEVEGKEVSLTDTEFRLLKFLMERCGRVQGRGQLLQNVWGYAEEIDTRTVDVHIRRLREKLGDHAELIETVSGVGYRLRGAHSDER